MDDCIFCGIIRGGVPSEIVLDEPHTLAFLDVAPRAAGHTVVVPKLHAATLLALSREDICVLFEGVQKAAIMIEKALRPDGFTIGINHGAVSGQTVPHLHVHIIPRFQGDGGGSVHSVVNQRPTESLSAIAEKIKNAG